MCCTCRILSLAEPFSTCSQLSTVTCCSWTASQAIRLHMWLRCSSHLFTSCSLSNFSCTVLSSCCRAWNKRKSSQSRITFSIKNQGVLYFGNRDLLSKLQTVSKFDFMASSLSAQSLVVSWDSLRGNSYWSSVAIHIYNCSFFITDILFGNRLSSNLNPSLNNLTNIL